MPHHCMGGLLLTRVAALVLRAMIGCALLVVPVVAQQTAPPLTVEKIYGHGGLIGNPPSGITWSPDGKHLTYIDGGELIDLDPGSGKPHVLVSRAKLAALGESPASEQDRDHRERYRMASYLWAPDCNHLLFDSNGRLWLYDLQNGTGVQIGFYRCGLRRRSQVFAQRRCHFVRARSWPGGGAPARCSQCDEPG